MVSRTRLSSLSRIALTNAGDFSVLHELAQVFSHPYDEQSAEIEAKYYRRPPSELEKKAGIAYFS